MTTGLSLSVDDAALVEGARHCRSAHLRLSAPSGKMVHAAWATVADTAAAGTDFTMVSGTVTFAPGEEIQTVAVPVVGDLVDEDDESLLLRLSAPLNAGLADAEAVGLITDDDSSGLAVGDAAVYEGDGEPVSLEFPVTLSRVNRRTVTVRYATLDGTALAGTDYQATSGTRFFPPATLGASIHVPVISNDRATDRFRLLLGTRRSPAGGPGQRHDP
jgi:chitinase